MVKIAFVATALLLGLVRVAAAQRIADAGPLRVADHLVLDAVATSPGDPRAAIERPATPVLWPTLAPAGNARTRPWLGNISLQLGSSRYRATAGNGAPVGGKISRTFLPIPIFQWQRYAPLVVARGYVAIDPSLVVGRRLTWSSRFAPGGRTFGIAVRMRIWLDRPDTPGAAAPQPTTEDRILSTLRSVLDRSAR